MEVLHGTIFVKCEMCLKTKGGMTCRFQSPVAQGCFSSTPCVTYTHVHACTGRTYAEKVPAGLLFCSVTQVLGWEVRGTLHRSELSSCTWSKPAKAFTELAAMVTDGIRGGTQKICSDCTIQIQFSPQANLFQRPLQGGGHP